MERRPQSRLTTAGYIHQQATYELLILHHKIGEWAFSYAGLASWNSLPNESTLWLLGMEMFFYIHFTWYGVFFHVYCLARTFFFDSHVSRLRIEAPPLSTVQGTCIYTLF